MVHKKDEFHNVQPLKLTREAYKELAHHTEICLPFEACGILVGSSPDKLDRFIPVTNVSQNPLHHFSLHPAEWTSLLLGGMPVQGLYHSHPSSPPVPSSEDLNQLGSFAGLFTSYLIAGIKAPASVQQHGQKPELTLTSYWIRENTSTSPASYQSHPSGFTWSLEETRLVLHES
ncbi:Mov34/MPN/PAD-1 family protein [Paenibacillus lemnae]|uniref:JAB domain-containing protein n=1 Tax=Paenibacillus lemnae TaxID=1330551 RepID=A0A848M371_PAELE|nr:Mov34/MPN/PAD-1 family protein [Paenibacillus lemnae]NMO95367.1 hypothetical protein [Paenibacillus lemnae]